MGDVHEDEELDLYVPQFIFDSARMTPEERGRRERIPKAELQALAVSGGISRIKNDVNPDAIWCTDWPEHGLVMARSTVAKRVLGERFGSMYLTREVPEQWWPARLVSIEEYLDYYGGMPAKFRPKFDAVGVIFLRPWWSTYVAENGDEAKMFELEAVEARASSLRELFPSVRRNPGRVIHHRFDCGPFPFSPPTDADSPIAKALAPSDGRLLITLPADAIESPQGSSPDDVDAVQVSKLTVRPPSLASSMYEVGPPENMPAVVEVATHFDEAKRIAKALGTFAGKYIMEQAKIDEEMIPKPDPRDRRNARLQRALDEVAGWGNWKKKTKKIDLSTAPLDVAYYPPEILNLDWRGLLDSHDIDLASHLLTADESDLLRLGPPPKKAPENTSVAAAVAAVDAVVAVAAEEESKGGLDKHYDDTTKASDDIPGVEEDIALPEAAAVDAAHDNGEPALKNHDVEDASSTAHVVATPVIEAPPPTEEEPVLLSEEEEVPQFIEELLPKESAPQSTEEELPEEIPQTMEEQSPELLSPEEAPQSMEDQPVLMPEEATPQSTEDQPVLMPEEATPQSTEEEPELPEEAPHPMEEEPVLTPEEAPQSTELQLPEETQQPMEEEPELPAEEPQSMEEEPELPPQPVQEPELQPPPEKEPEVPPQPTDDEIAGDEEVVEEGEIADVAVSEDSNDSMGSPDGSGDVEATEEVIVEETEEVIIEEIEQVDEEVEAASQREMPEVPPLQLESDELELVLKAPSPKRATSPIPRSRSPVPSKRGASPVPSKRGASPVPKRSYKFLEALPVVRDESDMCRQAFERASVHRGASLEPPSEAPLDVRRSLIYGDDDSCAAQVAASTLDALAANDGAGTVAFPELWLYLAARGASRRDKDSEEDMEDLWPSLPAVEEPVRKSSRVRSTSSRLADAGETYQVPGRRASQAVEKPPPRKRRRRQTCADIVEVLAERELAALLTELEAVALSCAATSAAACTGGALVDTGPPPSPSLSPRRRVSARRAASSDVVQVVEQPPPQPQQATTTARLRAARRERVAALTLLERVDAAIENLLSRDERQEQDHRRSAASRAAEAETVAERYKDDDDQREAARDLAVAAREAVDEAKHAAQDLANLRDAWHRTRTTIYFRICCGVARPCLVPSSTKEPAANRKKRRRDADAESDLSSENGRRSKPRSRFGSMSAIDEDPTATGKASDPAYAWDPPSFRPRTLAIYDRRCRLHGTKPQCVEQSRRAVAAASVVEQIATALPTRLWVERRVTNEYMRRACGLLSYVHERGYLSELRRRCGDLASDATNLFGQDDDDTSANKGTWDASVAASAAVLAAVDAVVSGEAKNALCAVRPPGHHAGATLRALGAPTNGYCVLNHAALGAKYAAHERGLRRVAVIDFDVHHGNGTEDSLSRTYDPSFLFISIHAAGEDVFPGTGRAPEKCLGDFSQVVDQPQQEAKDFEPGVALHRRHRSSSIRQQCSAEFLPKEEPAMTAVSAHPGVLNLPREPPPVTTDWLLGTALPRVLAELETFGPDLVILSAGFDAHKRDPVNLGRLDAKDYGELTRQILRLADRICCGRVVSVLEGGYGVDCAPSGDYLPSSRREAFDSCLKDHLTALVQCGTSSSEDDPAAPDDDPPQGDDDDLDNPDDERTSVDRTRLLEGLQRRETIVDAFFQRPPPSDANGGGELTAGNLATLGDDSDKMASFLGKRRSRD